VGESFGKPESVEQCLAIMAEVAEEQRDRNRHLDTKAGSIAGFAGTVAGTAKSWICSEASAATARAGQAHGPRMSHEPTTPKAPPKSSLAPALRDCSKRDGDVSPLLLGRALSELPFDAGGYLGELAVVERPYEHQACMRSLGFGPLARKRREVTTVAGYENTLLGCCQLEHLRIGQALVGGVLG
jgi:hypothetical protein